MADFDAVHPLGDLAGLQGHGDAKGGVSITIRHGFASGQLFCKKGKESALLKKLKIGSEPGVASETSKATFLPLCPNQWLMVTKGDDPAYLTKLEKDVSGLGYVSQQSDARVCFRISGPMARALMSRGCRLDLHESVVSTGYCAQTQMAQVGTIVHQLDDGPTYDIYVYSGFARSFWTWLSHTAAQFGYEVSEAAA